MRNGAKRKQFFKELNILITSNVIVNITMKKKYRYIYLIPTKHMQFLMLRAIKEIKLQNIHILQLSMIFIA